MNEKRLDQMFNNFKNHLLEIIERNQETTMSAITDLTDAVSALQSEDQEVTAAVLTLTQKIADLTAAVAAGGTNVDPAIVAATNAIKAEVVKLHDAVSSTPLPANVFPTDAQVSAFAALTPTPNADQIARFKTNNLTTAEKIQYGISSPNVSNIPTQAQIDAFLNSNPQPTADQVARFKSNNLTAAEKITFKLA